jgi:predicted  nucleic acid-binding Zn-ribbon protein
MAVGNGEAMGSERIDALLSLQELDTQIGRARSELRALDVEEEALDEQILQLEKQEAEYRSRLTEVETELRRFERTVQAGRATLKRLQTRAQEVHNMREHMAARVEVDAARLNLVAAEDQTLDAMQDQERARDALSDAEENLREVRDGHSRRKDEIAARRKELQESLAVHLDGRENQALRIDHEARSLYDRVRAGRAANTLAPLVESVCGNCYTAIPLQTQAEIKSGRDLVVCQACGVILHVEE